MLYWAFRIAAALARAAPLRLSYTLGRAIGIAVYYGWPGGRRRSIVNMRHIVGDEVRARALARQSFENYGTYLIDFLRFTAVTAEQVQAHLQFDGWIRLDAEREAGRGVVFVTMHYGNWDLGGAAVAARGLPISVVADTFPDPRLNKLVLGARRHLGMEILPAERMGPSLLRALKQRHVVAMLIDVPPREGIGIEAEFFGAPIRVADGPARLALRAGAAVFAVTVPRVDAMSEHCTVRWEQVRIEPTGDATRDAQALTQATLHALERQIVQEPEQWYIFRALWTDDRAAEGR